MLRIGDFPVCEKWEESANFMKSVGTFLQAEEDLKKRLSDKKITFCKSLGKEANDFEAFLELEKIRERRAKSKVT